MLPKKALPGEVMDLKPLGTALKDAKSTALVKAPTFEAIRLIVHAGEEIPTHQVKGYITVHCLEGEVEFMDGHSKKYLETGDWLFLEGNEPHLLKGITDSSLLVTILFESK